MARKKQQTDDVVIVGAAAHPLRDAYHSLLRMRWSGVIALIAAAVLVMNALFALGYLVTGGISGAAHGSFRDAFFFSVQTIGTVGYGAMYPVSTAANLLVTLETIAGLVMTALATGIVFARFTQSTGQLVFSQKACISPMDGVPTLAFRIGNDRASTVFEAVVRVALIRTERTKEGVIFYRLLDLELVRDRSPALRRSFTVMHRITEKSPLFHATPASCAAQEVELTVTVTGTDDISLQPVHAQRQYTMRDVVWGARLADVLSELPDGRLQLDVSRFDEVVPTEPTADFPYPKRA